MLELLCGARLPLSSLLFYRHVFAVKSMLMESILLDCIDDWCCWLLLVVCWVCR
jgi:hypothetical protein